MAPDEPTPRRRSRAARAKWIVGTTAVAAGVVLTGVVAAAGAGSDDPASGAPDPSADTYAPPAWPPPSDPSVGGDGDWRPYDPYGDDDDEWSGDDGGGQLVPTAPSSTPDTASRSS